MAWPYQTQNKFNITCLDNFTAFNYPELSLCTGSDMHNLCIQYYYNCLYNTCKQSADIVTAFDVKRQFWHVTSVTTKSTQLSVLVTIY